MALNGSQFPLSLPPCCSLAFPTLSSPALPTPPGWDSPALLFYSCQLHHLVPSAIPVWVPLVSPGVGVS